MLDMDVEGGGDAGQRLPGWRGLAAVALAYTACALAATYPAVLNFTTSLPSSVDPAVHLWTMRWYRSCLLHGKAPFLCPEVQHPVGAPLGFEPPLQYQTALYLALSPFLSNDVLIFNLIWVSNFTLVGLGTYVLAWWVVRDRLCAGLAGLLAMLSGPMMFFAHGEIEQITLGWFPLFLVAWLRWVDRPTRGRLGAAAALFLLLAASSPYAAVLGSIPAALYVGWRAAAAGRRGALRWAFGRAGWFAAFGAVTLPPLIALFACQVWAVTHGFPMVRGTSEFNRLTSSVWAYLFPAPPHLACYLMPSFYATPGLADAVQSYLGVVTLGLLAYAAVNRVRYDRRGFWWAALGTLVVLSLGGIWKVGRFEVPLPAQWLRLYCPAFRPIRVPARFNLFAAVVASVIAAAGLRHLLARQPGRWARVAVTAALAAVALADLSTVPFGGFVPTPPLPACYDMLFKKDARAVLLEVPQLNTGHELPATLTLWQSVHGGRTSAGHTAFPNVKQSDLLLASSPFHALRLIDPNYLNDPESESFDLVRGVRFRDQAWVYAAVHGFDYVVLHQRPGSYPEMPVRLNRVKALMAPAKIYEDEATAVYDPARLGPPDRPVVICTEGWRHETLLLDPLPRRVSKTARMVAYSPDPGRPMSLTLEARAPRQRRTVRLLSDDGAELARWVVEPGAVRTLVTPPFWLPRGLNTLTLASDGEVTPKRHWIKPPEGDTAPLSLWATGVRLDDAAAVAARPGGRSSR